MLNEYLYRHSARIVNSKKTGVFESPAFAQSQPISV